KGDLVGFSLLSANAIFRGLVIEVAAISLCSGLTVCLPPRSLLPLRVNPQGSRGLYIRAERASLPSHASDMLSARLQAIGGTRTSTSQDSQLVGCSLLFQAFPNATAAVLARPLDYQRLHFRRDPWAAGTGTTMGPVELLRYQSSIPGQKGIRLGSACDILQSFAAQSFGDLGQSGSLGIGQAE